MHIHISLYKRVFILLERQQNYLFSNLGAINYNVLVTGLNWIRLDYIIYWNLNDTCEQLTNINYYFFDFSI